LIYLADSFGYLGSVGILFYKNFSYPNISWLVFFKSGSIIISIAGLILTISSMIYFYKKYKRETILEAKGDLDMMVANDLRQI